MLDWSYLTDTTNVSKKQRLTGRHSQEKCCKLWEITIQNRSFLIADIWAMMHSGNSQSMQSWAFCDMGWDASFSWMTFFCLATKQNLLLDKIFFNLRFPKKWLRRCQRSRIITGSLGTRFGCKRSYHWRRRVHRKRQREINFFAHKTFVHNFSQALPRNHPETSAVKKKKRNPEWLKV